MNDAPHRTTTPGSRPGVRTDRVGGDEIRPDAGTRAGRGRSVRCGVHRKCPSSSVVGRPAHRPPRRGTGLSDLAAATKEESTYAHGATVPPAQHSVPGHIAAWDRVLRRGYSGAVRVRGLLLRRRGEV